jgi:hypothetical protein
MQTGMMTGYQSPGFTGGMMGTPMPLQPQVTALPGSNPIWQDMAAIQSGPSMPVLQPQNMMTGYNPMLNTPVTPMSGGWTGTPNMVPTAMTGVTGMATPMSAGFPMSPMSMGQVNPTGGTFTQMTGVPMQQPMYGMQSPQQMVSFQQQQQQQQQQLLQQQQQMYQQPLSPQPQMGQTLYVSNGVIVGAQPLGQPNPMMQPSPIQGMNPGMWAPQAGYGTQGQWHG